MSDDSPTLTETLTARHKSILIEPAYVIAADYRYVRAVVREDRLVWQGCHTYEDALHGRWVDIEDHGSFAGQASLP